MIEVYTNQYHADKLDFDLNENIITFLENDLELVSIIPVLKIPMGNAIVMVAKVDEWMFLAAANHIDNPKHEKIASFINAFVFQLRGFIE